MKKNKNKKNELPYRFTCPIPFIVTGHREITEEDLQLVREFKEQQRLEEERERLEEEQRQKEKEKKNKK